MSGIEPEQADNLAWAGEAWKALVALQAAPIPPDVRAHLVDLVERAPSQVRRVGRILIVGGGPR